MSENGTRGLDGPAADLLAACVEANVRSLAYTTDALQASMDALVDDMGAALVRLVDGLCAIPPTQRTVYVERLIDQASPAYEQAMRRRTTR